MKVVLILDRVLVLEGSWYRFLIYLKAESIRLQTWYRATLLLFTLGALGYCGKFLKMLTNILWMFGKWWRKPWKIKYVFSVLLKFKYLIFYHTKCYKKWSKWIIPCVLYDSNLYFHQKLNLSLPILICHPYDTGSLGSVCIWLKVEHQWNNPRSSS